MREHVDLALCLDWGHGWGAQGFVGSLYWQMKNIKMGIKEWAGRSSVTPAVII